MRFEKKKKKLPSEEESPSEADLGLVNMISINLNGKS